MDYMYATEGTTVLPSLVPAEGLPANPSPSLSSTRAGKRPVEIPATEPPHNPEPLFRPRKRQRSSSVDISNSSFYQRSSFASLWNPTNTSIHSATLPCEGRSFSASSGPATQATEKPPIRNSKSLPLTPKDPPSDHSSLRVETSQQTSRQSPNSGDKTQHPEPESKGPLDPPPMSSPPTQSATDPELGKPIPPSATTNPTQPAEIPWGPSHPCYPHPNSHVPLSSPLHNTTRIIRIKRDWMIAGDLAPTFSNIYPEILEPWVSEVDFRSLVQHVNEGLMKAFHPGGWRAWMDAVLGVATGWVWEDVGLTGVKSGVKNVEQYIAEWNGRDSKGAEDVEIEGARVIPLRRTGYLSLDIQIPDPHVGLVDGGVASKPSTRESSPKG